MEITEHQRQFRLMVERLPEEPERHHRWRNRDLNQPEVKLRKITGECRLSDLLKMQARAVMADITECPAPALPAHLARLRDLRHTIELVMANDFVPSDEAQLSGKQLQYPEMFTNNDGENER